MEANRIEEKIYKYGADILASEGMQKEKTFVQHGSITCYDHSLRVAEKSLQRNVPHILMNGRWCVEHCFMIISCMTGMRRMADIGCMVFFMQNEPCIMPDGISI